MKTSRALLIFLLLTVTSPVDAQDARNFFPDKNLMTVGIYYYPEHWSPSQWERDIKQISAMGFEFIHMAEFAWAQMEPEEGKYTFEWLDRVIDLAGKHNLKVVLCTPSATPPVWLGIKHPEIYIMYSNYVRSEHGTRANGSLSNEIFRQYVERVNTAMARRYGNNKNVVGWQLDNEPEGKSDFSPVAQKAFRQWLQSKYKTIAELNRAWGNAFWSQLYNSFDQVIIPNAGLVGWWGSNPHALLDYRRFTAEVQAEFLDFQAAALRKYISPSQYITTNYTAVCRDADPRRTKLLDFTTFTVYPNGGQHNLGNQGFRLGDSRPVLFASDYYRNIAGVTGVMELQPGPVNWGGVNPLLLPGTVRMWLWHCFGAGSSLACSYRFRQLLYSAEQYHSGIVKTDGVTPSPGGEEYVQFMRELKELRKLYKLGGKMPEKLAARNAAILWNHENFWSLDRQKQTFQWDAWGYPLNYLEILKSFGAPVDIVGEEADLSKYRFVIAPAYELVDSTLIKKWDNYAANGGNLVVTCRTAIKDRSGHFWEAEIAAPISGLIGARIGASDMLPADVQGEITSKSTNYLWNNWADLLEPEKGTEVLATYSNQFYAGKAAAVKRTLGKGTVTYIGVDTDDSKLEKVLLREIFNQAGATTEDYPTGVYVNWRDGFFVAVNYSSENYTVTVPASAQILAGDRVLGPAGVVVWSE